MVPSREFRALYNFNETGVEPDPGQRRGHTPIFYDPATGVLHNEALGAASGVWAVASRGWIQESWPRAMKDACPDVALPADLPINEKQTPAVFDEMMAQDPNCADPERPESRRRGGSFEGPFQNNCSTTNLDAIEPFGIQSCRKIPAFYCVEEEQKLMDAAEVEMDPAKREAMLRQLLAMNAENASAIFLVELVDVFGLHKRVQGFEYHTFRLNYDEMTLSE